jgi:hypothetical protein
MAPLILSEAPLPSGIGAGEPLDRRLSVAPMMD